jgi:hypothetical protein
MELNCRFSGDLRERPFTQVALKVGDRDRKQGGAGMIREKIKEGKVEPRIVELAKKLEGKLKEGAADPIIERHVILLIGAILVATEDIFPTVNHLAVSYDRWAKVEGERLLREKQREAYLKKKEDNPEKEE